MAKEKTIVGAACKPDVVKQVSFEDYVALHKARATPCAPPLPLASLLRLSPALCAAVGGVCCGVYARMRHDGPRPSVRPRAQADMEKYCKRVMPLDECLEFLTDRPHLVHEHCMGARTRPPRTHTRPSPILPFPPSLRF